MFGVGSMENKLLRVFCLLCAGACLISLFGCSKEKPNDFNCCLKRATLSAVTFLG